MLNFVPWGNFMKSKKNKIEDLTSGQQIKYHRIIPRGISPHGILKQVWKIDFGIYSWKKNMASSHRMGWKNFIILFPCCVLYCSQRHNHASSFCLQLRYKKTTWKIYFFYCNHYFQFPSHPLTAILKTLRHEQAQGLIQSQKRVVCREILPYLLTRENILPNTLTRDCCFQNHQYLKKKKQLCNHISILVIVNDTTTAVSSQLVASNGAQNGMWRQSFKMKTSKVME